MVMPLTLYLVGKLFWYLAFIDYILRFLLYSRSILLVILIVVLKFKSRFTHL